MNFLYTVFCIKLLLVIHFMNTPKFVWPLNIYMFYSFLTILHSMMNIPIHWFSIHISHYFHKIDFWKWNFFHSFGKYSYLFFLSHTVSPVYSQNSVLNCSFIHHHTNSDYYHSVNHWALQTHSRVSLDKNPKYPTRSWNQEMCPPPSQIICSSALEADVYCAYPPVWICWDPNCVFGMNLDLKNSQINKVWLAKSDN